MGIGRLARLGGFAVILFAALAVRLHGIGFGLPSLYDPDEPLFMVLALKLLNEPTLNPGWFGHPGSTTIYLIAAIDLAVLGLGMLTGDHATVADFARAAYADPALLFIPARTAMALFGAGCVWLTFVLGRRLFGRPVGYIAAAFLAANSLHILWSQVIRTDVMASFFMLASLIFSVRAARDGRLRDYMLSGAFIGVAIATKWPSAIVVIGLIGAALVRLLAPMARRRHELRNLAVALACIIAALFLSSPYIFLDWRTVLANVSGEVNHGHLAQNGGGFLYNLRWYALGQVAGSMGVAGLLLAAGGTVAAWRREALARWTVIPVLVGFFVLICSQSMVWSRWLIPAIPLLCILAAVLIDSIGRRIAASLRFGAAPATALVAILAALPSIASARDRIREREVDTRAMAATWAVANIPRGSTVLLENLELGLRHQPWRFLFPLGKAGCVDGLELLSTGVSYDRLEQLRGGPILDVGNVGQATLNTCRSDYAILTYFDSYRSEAADFPRELENYRRLLANGRTVALFAPTPGRVGGPTVRIVALRQQPSKK